MRRARDLLTGGEIKIEYLREQHFTDKIVCDVRLGYRAIVAAPFAGDLAKSRQCDGVCRRAVAHRRLPPPIASRRRLALADWLRQATQI